MRLPRRVQPPQAPEGNGPPRVPYILSPNSLNHAPVSFKRVTCLGSIDPDAVGPTFSKRFPSFTATLTSSWMHARKDFIGSSGSQPQPGQSLSQVSQARSTLNSPTFPSGVEKLPCHSPAPRLPARSFIMMPGCNSRIIIYSFSGFPGICPRTRVLFEIIRKAHAR